jgi:hypothetical protein
LYSSARSVEFMRAEERRNKSTGHHRFSCHVVIHVFYMHVNLSRSLSLSSFHFSTVLNSLAAAGTWMMPEEVRSNNSPLVYVYSFMSSFQTHLIHPLPPPHSIIIAYSQSTSSGSTCTPQSSSSSHCRGSIWTTRCHFPSTQGPHPLARNRCQ